MNQNLKISVVALLTGGAGLIVGYKMAEIRLTARFEERLDKETEQMREFYQAVKKPYATPEEAVKDLVPPPSEKVDPRVKTQKVAYHKIVKSEGYEPTDEEIAKAEARQDEKEAFVEMVEERQNIFDANRDPEKPYLISQDEFLANEAGYIQSTLTYYEADKVLADEKDDIIDDKPGTVGKEFADAFGHKNHPNEVYVRNEKIQMDFEITRSERSFAEDVLGETEQGETPRQRIQREQRGD